jgi:hypothetical protein
MVPAFYCKGSIAGKRWDTICVKFCAVRKDAVHIDQVHGIQSQN